MTEPTEPLTFWQALKQLPQGFLNLFAAWAEDIKLRRERDWTAEYRKAYEAGHEAARRELGLLDREDGLVRHPVFGHAVLTRPWFDAPRSGENDA